MTRNNKISLLHDLHRMLIDPAVQGYSDDELDRAIAIAGRMIRDANRAMASEKKHFEKCKTCENLKGYDPELHGALSFMHDPCARARERNFTSPAYLPEPRWVYAEPCVCDEDDDVVEARKKYEDAEKRIADNHAAKKRAEEVALDRDAEVRRRHLEEAKIIRSNEELWHMLARDARSARKYREAQERKLRRLEAKYHRETHGGHSDGRPEVVDRICRTMHAIERNLNR